MPEHGPIRDVARCSDAYKVEPLGSKTTSSSLSPILTSYVLGSATKPQRPHSLKATRNVLHIPEKETVLTDVTGSGLFMQMCDFLFNPI